MTKPAFARSAFSFIHRVGLAAGLALAAFALPHQAAAADCRSAPAPATDWQDCNKSSIMLGGSDLRDSNLVGVDFSATDLRGSVLDGSNLEKAKLLRSSLADASAANANFSRVEAYRTNFSGIRAKGANFTSAELQRADFNGADLEGSDFEKSELGRASFRGALISGTNFAHANLSRADLSQARFAGPIDFTGAFLYLTRIEGIDLSAAKGLKQEQADQACGDHDTVLPRGLKPPANWPCTFSAD